MLFMYLIILTNLCPRIGSNVKGARTIAVHTDDAELSKFDIS